MKPLRFFFSLTALAVLIFLPSSCSSLFSDRTGELLVRISPASSSTKSSLSLPDVDDFILSVVSSDGDVIYEGRYGSSPDSFTVPTGSYTVSAVSGEFAAPRFDAPQFGDTQVVVVQSGASVSASLLCKQLSGGLRLLFEDSFTSSFPDGKLTLKGTDGSLEYPYTESRIAYFNPGSVSLILSENGMDQTLFARTLEGATNITMRLSSSVSPTSGGVSIQLDTVRTWVDDTFCFGESGGLTADGAYTVSEARDHAGQNDCWVCGYIVGVATNTAKFAFEAPFTKNTNIVLGAKEGSTDKENLLSVELPSGAIRSALNLVDNPSLKGRKVAIRGNLVSAYYGIPGLKAPTEYQFR